MTDQQKQFDSAIAAGCPGVPNISNAGPLIHGKGFIEAALASVQTEKAALMIGLLGESISHGTANPPSETSPDDLGTVRHDGCGGGVGSIPRYKIVYRTTTKGVELTIYDSGTMSIETKHDTYELFIPATSLELAYAAANALAEATGGWQC